MSEEKLSTMLCNISYGASQSNSYLKDTLYKAQRLEQEKERLEKAFDYVVRVYLVPDDYMDEEEKKLKTEEYKERFLSWF